ncbi:hypothetical protein HDU98_011091 [Podochytrium sp. JEL0797]|nr:hypothetical protein HDU98_011091 [Podochytrium sp. JEL0797]
MVEKLHSDDSERPDHGDSACIDLRRSTVRSDVQPLRKGLSLKSRLIPQESGDLKSVLWLSSATFLSKNRQAGFEIWVIINQVRLRNSLLPTSSEQASEDIWYNFKIEVTYESVFVASIWFWLFLTWDAIIHLNTVEILAINAYNVGLFAFGVSQIIQINSDHSGIMNEISNVQFDFFNTGGFLVAQIIIPIVIGLYSCLFGLLLCPKLVKDFGWRQYRITGGSIALNKVFLVYDVTLLLLKFCLFFVTGFTIIDLGFYGSRYEIRWLMIGYQLGILVSLGYIIQRIYAAYTQDAQTSSRVEVPFLVYAACSAMLLMASFVFGMLCMSNFGKGLKEVLDQEVKRKNGDFVPQAIDLDA